MIVIWPLYVHQEVTSRLENKQKELDDSLSNHTCDDGVCTHLLKGFFQNINGFIALNRKTQYLVIIIIIIIMIVLIGFGMKPFLFLKAVLNTCNAMYTYPSIFNKSFIVKNNY